MNKRELLEAAARAAGIEIEWDARGCFEVVHGISGNDKTWNPLEDDGDALRLAVKLKFVVHVWDDGETVSVAKTQPDGEDPDPVSGDWHSADAYACGSIEAATRLAITRAAAAIDAQRREK